MTISDAKQRSSYTTNIAGDEITSNLEKVSVPCDHLATASLMHKGYRTLLTTSTKSNIFENKQLEYDLRILRCKATQALLEM